MRNLFCPQLLYFAFIATIFPACNGHKESADTQVKPFPRPGTEIASMTEAIKEDVLNKSSFSVRVIADSDIAKGVYDIDADYGPNFAESKMSLPTGGEHFMPAIRKGGQPYTYIVGFHIPGDTAFYDYFEVSSTRGQTKMRYIKAYSF